MKSKWYELKEKAIVIRRKGRSIGYIEKHLGIPRSTLSGWFKTVKLTAGQKRRLVENINKGLIRARQRAVLWHNAQRLARLQEAEKAAESTLKNIDIERTENLDLALAMLYLGEGFKKNIETGMGNSDPMILKFFVSVLQNNYNIPVHQIKCELHLRADQDPEKIKRFWAKELNLPDKNFTGVILDQRTKGRPTYAYYKGVCVVRCGNVAIQRKLIALSKLFCRQAINNHTMRG